MNYIHIYVLLYTNPLYHDCYIKTKDAMEWEDVKESWFSSKIKVESVTNWSPHFTA